MKNNNLQQLLQTADLDIEFSYQISAKRFNNACRVRFFNRQPQIIILTELKNSEMSVTNSIEFIIPQLERFLLFEKAIAIAPNCVYIEHYDESSYEDCDFEETFDRVMLLDGRPGWNRLSSETVFLYLA